MQKEIDQISDELVKLSKATKLKDILKKHKNIKNNLNNAQENLNLLKNNFESNDVEKETQMVQIDDDTYEKYSKEILDTFEIDFDKIDIETQIKKYKLLSKKISSCDNYLKTKKMEIINCDKNIDIEK